MVRPPLVGGKGPPGEAAARSAESDTAPGGAGTAEPVVDAVLVLATLGAPERRLLRGRRGREVEEAEPTPVPITRATVVRPQPFADAAAADAWLDGLRSDRDAAHAEVDAAVAILNRAVQAYRIAAADPYATPVGTVRALVTRVGYGDGNAVADGRAQRAWELPPGGPRKRLRSMEAPDERFASILGGRREALACEELVLRAATDLRAGRDREAALETRVALEALLAEVPEAGEPLAGCRADASDAAAAALEGPLDASGRERLAAVIEAMERQLRNRRLTT